MKIISFLGFMNYQETVYLNPQKPGSGCKTPFFQEALVEFYQPDQLYVLLTKTVETQVPKDATETNWFTLQKRLAGRVDLQPVKNIPEQNTPDDIWTVFQRVNECLEEGDRVLFDITYSFRYVPVVALISVSYLRIVRQISIEGLLYGAYDAKNRETNETPTFDLLPIVSLLDWTTATDQFIKTGNGQTLANLLEREGDSAAKELAQGISAIAEGLHLLRPTTVMRQSARLPTLIQSASSTISQTVPPFATLLSRVQQDYAAFGIADPDNYQLNAQATLVCQLKMIEWYTKKEQIVQALSMAREWLPSLLCCHFKLDPQISDPNRAEMELLLAGGKVKDKETNKIIKVSSYLEKWESLPKQMRKPITRLWGGDLNLASLRNDVLHAGFRKNPRTPEDWTVRSSLLGKLLGIKKDIPTRKRTECRKLAE
jgi:CRISPR-associated Csx2 family protein